MRQAAVQGSGYQGSGPLYLIDYVPHDRVLVGGSTPLATRASRVGVNEVKGGDDRVLVQNRLPVAGSGDPIKGPMVNGVINVGTDERVLIG